ncbi:uncharacterized protein LOC109858282 [Pseudomyrmex gracilis]|uniref:uncharacterized protein LOC109858282 n=1 Tax=Pseudomyrmex gracilis TaxID=219809 RepID=UPI00099524F2|nr:uncharacterized protein LOC109858282 [Pseudomyrmex gracilis]
MRRSSFDKLATNGRRNVLSNASYGHTIKDAEYSVSYSSSSGSGGGNYLQRSVSADNVVIRSRGYKPSDRHDPVKRNFLENLTSRILHVDMEGEQKSSPINLQKLLTPASDSHEIMQTKSSKKMYASSYFYAPSHPTVEDQVELARRISHSLSDVKNVKSKGQSMYVNRKKRSVKWIHDGNGVEDEEESITTVHKDKLPLKCVMNPCGKVLDIQGIQALGEEVNIAPVPKHPEKLFDIVRDLNNQRGRGAEIFAKRRKRSEKWVVDQEQPHTPVTPATPKTPVYPEKLEINGNAMTFATPSLTPHTPAPSIDKSFYNPFTADISLNNANVPTTDGCRSHCNANRCSHSTEVKKIYLREIAVGTDASDFPAEQSLPSVVERSYRIAFGSPNITNNRAHNNNNKYINNNNNNNNSHQSPRKSVFCNAQNNNSDARAQQRVGKYNNAIGNKQQNGTQNDNEENGYTPVPVKQLIQEFEKTCRPVLQYKQISPKIIPIVQQCPLDSDIARLFGTRNPKYNNDEEEYARARENYERSATLQSQYNNGHLYETRESYERKLRSSQRNDQQLCNARASYMGSTKLMPSQCNGYVSTDESEYTTDETTDSSEEIDDYPREIAGSIDRGSSAPSALFNCCDSSEYSIAFDDEYNGAASNRRRSTTSQELETLYEASKEADARFVNAETEIPPEAKSLMLSMVASQEDILETKKHLRSTPVLDNLVGTATPEYKLDDANPELGNKLYENNNYTGPKVVSLHNLANYNTAPRGWNQSFTFYRPIKFEKPQEIMYSDF